MDVANFHLARHLAEIGREVHLVAHRVAPDLLAMPGVQWHRVAKPFNSYLLGEGALARAGSRWGRTLAARGGRLVANGGNCVSPDLNWVHYVHAGHPPAVAASWRRRLQGAWTHRRFVAAERSAVRAARLVVANSNRTRRDLIALVGAAPERVHTVYYGTDADYHRPPDANERLEARQALGWSDGRPSLAFVGALGDRRKGFDQLFAGAGAAMGRAAGSGGGGARARGLAAPGRAGRPRARHPVRGLHARRPTDPLGVRRDRRAGSIRSLWPGGA
jgi:glycosyltransferase involved in cell wall biosynthesis